MGTTICKCFENKFAEGKILENIFTVSILTFHNMNVSVVFFCKKYSESCYKKYLSLVRHSCKSHPLF